jgi:two-component system phosphate regulon sensor histidine kinase PhoR
MKKLRWLAILMGITILGITGFQGYWLHNNYEREKQNLEIKTGADFHQTLLRLQASKLNLEELSIQLDSLPGTVKANVVVQPGKRPNVQDTTSNLRKATPITMINLLQEKIHEAGGDTGKTKAFIISGKDGFTEKISSDSLTGFRHGRFNTKIESIAINSDSFPNAEMIREIKMGKQENAHNVITITYAGKGDKKDRHDSLRLKPEGVFIERHDPVQSTDEDAFSHGIPGDMKRRNAVLRFLYNADSVSLKDSVTVKEITNAYTVRLKQEKMRGLSFAINRVDSNYANSNNPYDVTIGFARPITYHLSIENEIGYLLKKLTLPLLFSIFLVGITVISFALLYRNLIKQRRLADLKNEFISNITHELKTPIATVGVAIEALKNFNAIHDPQRTKEYLDISQNELQRLGLLVDKVLKLSMFEKKEMELKKEQFDCKQLTEEVMSSMKLQFEKYRAKVKLYTKGNNFIVEADKLHITSVIYNLLDNALKYSKENPVIDVGLKSYPEYLEFSVSDNGIGIAHAYKGKVFDKFFRVPTGDRHNIKGYGLGLSYVSEVLKRHHGNVVVESELGKGSTFTARFPYV